MSNTSSSAVHAHRDFPFSVCLAALLVALFFSVKVAVIFAAVKPAVSVAASYHVAVTGNDANKGSASAPFRTIFAAAQKAMPGDTITVHAGVYRERIDPPRGGTSDMKRITYQSAPGEHVVITGSEPARGWEKVKGDTWKLVLPNNSFGSFNPYSDRIRGDWFTPKNRVHHTGCVYLNGDWMIESRSLDEVMAPAGTTPLWYATVDGDSGKYLVNITWFKPVNGGRVAAGEPSLRYGTKPAPCNEGGTCTGFIMTGDHLQFDEVDFGKGSESVELRIAAATETGAIIEMRSGSNEGELLGTCSVEPTGDWQKWQSVTMKIRPVSGRQTICLVFLSPGVRVGNTTIYAQFPGVNPNEAQVEINKRQTIFYPSRNFINYITVKGFTLEHAATNWAPPSAEQVAIIGTNWSKGWVIENNTVRYSKCSGISLGKYGDGTDNTNDAGQADPYTACVRRALNNGWNKKTVGSHIVRNNHIHHCEQAGIVGSMGCAFSTVTGNDIHDIHVRQLFSGAEMGGIKFHGGIDVIIRGNHIYRCGDVAGLWLDWMAQGAIVTNNLFHDNTGSCGDVFFEMQHGPMLFANNLILSKRLSFTLNSKSIAVVHNLITGNFNNISFDERNTPFHRAHSTEIAGLYNAPAGDHRFYNNLFAEPCLFAAMDNCRLDCFASGNIFTRGTTASKFDTQSLVKPDDNPDITLTERSDGWYLELTLDRKWMEEMKCQHVTTQLLGMAKVPNLPYENPDASPISIDKDYFGNKRNLNNPFPGPFEITRSGRQEFKIWPIGSGKL